MDLCYVKDNRVFSKCIPGWCYLHGCPLNLVHPIKILAYFRTN
jgi:hypothetical protein